MVKLEVKLGLKGQIVIPKIFRDEINIYPGSRAIMSLQEEKIIIEKKQARDIIELLGRISEEATKKRKGKKLEVNPRAIFEQYEKRARRASL